MIWQDIDFNAEKGFENPAIRIEAQLQRVSKETYELLDRKQNHVKFVFPDLKEDAKSMLVLKNLKTDASRRVVYLTKTTMHLLWLLKEEQNGLKESLGDEYQDYDLVIAQRNGRPIEGGFLDKLFARFIKDNNLPTVEFHSLRHLSATLKLIISGGDIKTVQRYTGHQDARMVINQYAHAMEKNCKENALMFDSAFYGKLKSGNTDISEAMNRIAAYCLQNPKGIEELLALIPAN